MKLPLVIQNVLPKKIKSLFPNELPMKLPLVIQNVLPKKIKSF
jgi:hypothetical protein